MEILNAEVLDSIKSFSGTPEEMTPGERILSEGKALQRVQTQYTTAVAVQKPRSIAKVTANVLAESKLAGAAFYYRWMVKGKDGEKKPVQGPSIDLAMCIARNYGNCVVDIEGTETPTHYMFKGVFIDLETGFTVPRLYRQRKKQDMGKGYGDDRAEDLVFQIGQSKAQRNAITKAAPGWLVDQAIEEARQAEINKIKPENLHVARGKVLDFFASYGVTQDRIEAERGRPADQWTAEDLADLRGSATALKEGRIGPDELFPEDHTIPDPDSVKEPPANPPRGRKPGSKNKPKEPPPVADTPPAPGGSGTATDPLPPVEPEDPGPVEEEKPLFPAKDYADDKVFGMEAEHYWEALPEKDWGVILEYFKVKSHMDTPVDRRTRFINACRTRLEKLNASK